MNNEHYIPGAQKRDLIMFAQKKRGSCNGPTRTVYKKLHYFPFFGIKFLNHVAMFTETTLRKLMPKRGNNATSYILCE